MRDGVVIFHEFLGWVKCSWYYVLVTFGFIIALDDWVLQDLKYICSSIQ